MNTLVALAVVVGAGLLIIYLRQRSRTTRTTRVVSMYPVIVGEKTELYEVVAPNALRLAPGVKFRVVETPGGNSGIVLLKAREEIGGFFSCGCVGATTSSCITTSDNPDHPSCSGGCTDSEGNVRGCMLFGPIIGPPKDPIMYLERR
jgi:hypothetical protein